MRVIRKNDREVLRVQISEFQGSRFLDVRSWTTEGEGRPTKKGVTIPLGLATEFVDAVSAVVREEGATGA